MMYNYCTLFNSNYLTCGLAMYESLKKHGDEFHLYIFAFDNRSEKLLKKLNLEFVTVISLQEFEDEFAKFCGVNHCVGVASGLDALILAIDAFDFPKNSEIIVPSNTYIATIMAIIKNGF